MSAAKPKRLGHGELDDLVLAFMRNRAQHGPLTATAIAKGLGGRSAGAVANCLARLTKDKKVRQTKRHPRAYVIEGATRK
jgi:hypothetical protein